MESVNSVETRTSGVTSTTHNLTGCGGVKLAECTALRTTRSDHDASHLTRGRPLGPTLFSLTLRDNLVIHDFVYLSKQYVLATYLFDFPAAVRSQTTGPTTKLYHSLSSMIINPLAKPLPGYSKSHGYLTFL